MHSSNKSSVKAIDYGDQAEDEIESVELLEDVKVL